MLSKFKSIQKWCLPSRTTYWWDYDYNSSSSVTSTTSTDYNKETTSSTTTETSYLDFFVYRDHEVADISKIEIIQV